MRAGMLTIVCLTGITMAMGTARADGWWPFGGSSSAVQPAVRRTAEPTMWQRMSQGTSNLVQGTQRALNPWSQPTPVKERAFPGGAQKVQRISRNKTEESAPWWYPWQTIEETSPKYENPSDWLSQPRLQ